MGSRGSSKNDKKSKPELGDMRCEVGNWIPMA